MLALNSKNDPDWLAKSLEGLRYAGAAIVTDVLGSDQLERIREAMYATQARTLEDIGRERLERARELGVLRVMMRYDQVFAELLQLPEMLAIVDEFLCDTAILHLQNGFILPPFDRTSSDVPQYVFHMDFPRYMEGYVSAVNVMFAIDAFSAQNGGTLVVPGTHQRSGSPDPSFLESAAIPVECPAGSILAFDSTIWHAAGHNMTDRDRLAINHMFTRSFLKQQIDYVRALGDEFVLSQRPRTQQLLGWYTRVVTSSDEYYRPAADRLYRSGQG